MRILLLAQFFPPDIGGEERHVFNLANTLAERGHEVAVATQRMAGVPDQETLASGVRVHRFATAAMRLPGVYSTSRPHHPPLPDPLGVRELSRIIRRERPRGCTRAQLDRQQCCRAAPLVGGGIALRTRPYVARLQSRLRDEETDADGLAV